MIIKMNEKYNNLETYQLPSELPRDRKEENDEDESRDLRLTLLGINSLSSIVGNDFPVDEVRL